MAGCGPVWLVAGLADVVAALALTPTTLRPRPRHHPSPQDGAAFIQPRRRRVTTLPPAPRPCTSCPYKRDTPSGIWSPEEYAKLALYDGPTWSQPPRLFQCHVHDHDADGVRVCGGWAGCHDMAESLSLRLAVECGQIGPHIAQAILDYESPAPLFTSGSEAAAHGLRDLHTPGPAARRAINKITRTRTDLT
ncbi:DUF6283 family protein [Streptomyces sp. NPDC001941]|uniref:DUF6283 family protein n=1 Tax=Streptomyces sp. NPDC001941 TaxID=3154659 RepID=UPI003317B2B2